MKEIEFVKKISKITKIINLKLRESDDQSEYGQDYEHENSITEILEVANDITFKDCIILSKIFKTIKTLKVNEIRSVS